MTDTNVFQLSQPGTFADPLTEVLRNGARALLAQAFVWARDADPSQPLTSGVWQHDDWTPTGGKLTPMEKLQLGQSDVISFHDYSWPETFEARVRQLLALRTTGSEPVSGPATASARFAIATCVAPDGYRASSCPALEPDGMRRIGPGTRFTATLVNRGKVPAHMYLLAIDPLNAVTLVVPRRAGLDLHLGEPESTIGLRVPDHALVRAVARDVGPIAATSANRHGEPTRSTAAEVSADLGPGVELVVDGGELNDGASTVIDATRRPWRILREGPIAAADILATAGAARDDDR